MAPFEVRMQIYVPVNVVLLHPGICHETAQHTARGQEDCLHYILRYHATEELLGWLTIMDSLLKGTQAEDAIRWTNEYTGRSV